MCPASLRSRPNKIKVAGFANAREKSNDLVRSLDGLGRASREPRRWGDGESKGRVRMTTVDDRMPTKDLEVEVREPAWATKVRLDVRDRCSAHGCTWAQRRPRERPERTLYDVSARLRFGRYQM